jgi:hypothetical protein
MIKTLRALLSKTPREHLATKPALSARSATLNAGGDYRAVSVVPSIIEYCSAVKGATGKRFLLGEAPRLPLAACTMPANCLCKFRKHADRREGDRRLLFGTHTNRSFAGPERRKHANRRSTTHWLS